MLENPKMNIKIKLAALWTSVLFCYIYGDYFELYVPEKVTDLANGESILDSPMKLFIASILMAIPSIMISLSIILKPKLGRILNIVFGILFTLIMLIIGFGSLTKWYSFYAFLAFLESGITFLIVFYAIKWPKSNMVIQH